MHGGNFKALVSNPALSSSSVTIAQSVAVHLHVYNCLVIIIEYRSALHTMTLMGGAAASETLIGGYIWTIGVCGTPQKQPRENAVPLHWLTVLVCVHMYAIEYTSSGSHLYTSTYITYDSVTV